MLSPETQRIRATEPIRRVALLRELGRANRVASLALARSFEALGIAVSAVPANRWPDAPLEIDHVIDLVVTLAHRPSPPAIRAAWSLDAPLATIGEVVGPEAVAEFLARRRSHPRAVIEVIAPQRDRRCAAGRLEIRSSEEVSVITDSGADQCWAAHELTWRLTERSDANELVSASLTLHTVAGAHTLDVGAATVVTIKGLHAPSTFVSLDGSSEIWRHSDTMLVSVVPAGVRIVEPWHVTAGLPHRHAKSWA